VPILEIIVCRFGQEIGIMHWSICPAGNSPISGGHGSQLTPSAETRVSGIVSEWVAERRGIYSMYESR
jgi:hypothetical protein